MPRGKARFWCLSSPVLAALLVLYLTGNTTLALMASTCTSLDSALHPVVEAASALDEAPIVLVVVLVVVDDDLQPFELLGNLLKSDGFNV